MTEDEEVTEIQDAEQEADEILHFAILQCFAMNQDRRFIFNMLGMEIALLRHAARIDQILKERGGSSGTKATFGNLARAEYADVLRYRTKKQKPRPKPKGHLSVVK